MNAFNPFIELFFSLRGLRGLRKIGEGDREGERGDMGRGGVTGEKKRGGVSGKGDIGLVGGVNEGGNHWVLGALMFGRVRLRTVGPRRSGAKVGNVARGRVGGGCFRCVFFVRAIVTNRINSRYRSPFYTFWT